MIILAAVVIISTGSLVIIGRRGGEAGAQHAPDTIMVGDNGCAPGLTTARSGRSVYRVVNDGPSPEEVTVLDGDHHYAYAALEMIAPGTTSRFVVLLPPGSYSWSCEADDGTVGYSDPITVHGPAVAGVHRWVPATYAELSNAVTRYRRSVTTGLARLATDTDRLLAAVHDHDVATARVRWLTAHLDYERLGAAYDTFGAYADAIDGRPDGLPGGVGDPHFTGFHRLEYLLWQHGSPAKALTAATRLDADVHRLVKAFPRQLTAPNDVALRTHEILENTLQFELTADTDQGSHTNLATAAANLDGTRMTLQALTPLLARNDPQLLRSVRTGLDRLGRALSDSRRPDGSWPAVQRLSTAQREQIDGRLADALERLAPVPTELEILTTHDNS
jgi:high-affinity iron transporter